MAARIFEPEPISVERLSRRSNYTSPALLESHLQRGLSLSLLETQDGKDYVLTPIGKAAVRTLIDTAYAAMTPLQPLAATELERFAALLSRLVESCLAAPEPPDKWGLQMARHYDPGASAPVMVRLDQYLSDLDAYRDDCHLASWKRYGISGHAWEAFTLLWRGAAQNLDDLCLRLAHRGYSRKDYLAALGDLESRGWVLLDGETWRLTHEGRIVRESAEKTTNLHFYMPWACLSVSEIDELDELSARLREGLEAELE
jgi:hypothetical protein